MIKHNKNMMIYAWFCWGLTALLHLLHTGLLVFPSGIPEQLEQSLQIGPKGLSILFTTYLYVFIFMQIPAGLIYDRFPIHRVITPAAICLAIGCLIMALSEHIYIVIAARMLMGLGGSFMFLGSIYLGREWFPAVMFPFIVGLTEAIGGIGSILFTSLFVWLTKFEDYHLILIEVAGLLLFLSFIVFVFMREPPDIIKKSDVQLGKQFSYLLRNPEIWLLGVYSSLLFSHILVMQNMWGISLLEATYHLTPTSAVFENGLVMVGYIFGAIAIGYCSRYLLERKLMLWCSVIQFICLSVLYFVHPNLIIHSILVIIGGGVTGSLVLSFDIVRKIVPVEAQGVAAGLLNMFIGCIGITINLLVGYLLQITHNNFHLSTAPVIVCSFATIPFAILLLHLGKKKQNLIA